MALFKPGGAEPAANGTAIVELQVDEVEAGFSRLKNDVDVVHEPKMMPWGNRAAQFRDPEGTLVSLYTPVTDAAKRRIRRPLRKDGGVLRGCRSQADR